MKKRIYVLLIPSLVLLDLFVKIIVNKYFMNESITLFNRMLGFEPYLHQTKDAYINYYLKTSHSDIFQIIFGFVVLFVPLALYFFLKKSKADNKISNYLLCFFSAGCICSFIDKLFWGGSLDYILFIKWIADLKDIYLTISEVLLVVYLVKFIKEDYKNKKRK